MAAYLLNTVIRLGVAFTNTDGVATDPTDLTLTITKPDGSTLVKQLADVSNDTGAGNFHYDYTPTVTGEYNAEWVGTGAVAAPAISGFRIVDPADALVPINLYRTICQDTTSDDADILDALLRAQQAIEETLDGRLLTYAQRTETLPLHRDGRVYPRAVPLNAVSDPASAAIDGHAVTTGSAGNSATILWTARGATLTTITYTGGFQPYGRTGGPTPALPYTLAEAICRTARNALTPVVLAGVPAGATSVSTGDVSISAKTGLGGLPPVVDPAIRASVRGYARRTVPPGRTW